MTPSELKQRVQETGSYHFDRKTMQFFGDTMRNYGVRSGMIGDTEVWELYRKHPVKHGLKDSAYFDKTTFKRIFLKI